MCMLGEQRLIARGKSSTLLGWPSSGRVIHPIHSWAPIHSTLLFPFSPSLPPKQLPKEPAYVTGTTYDSKVSGKKMHDFATNPEIQIKCHGPVRKLTNDLITRFCLFQIESLKICLTQSNTTLAAGVKLQGHFKYPACRKKKVFQNASFLRVKSWICWMFVLKTSCKKISM